MKLGRAGLATTGISIGLTILVALLGPSAMQPGLSGRPGQPPYSLVTHPSADIVVALAGLALAAGAAGLGLCMYAARRGWTPSPRALVIAGIAAAAVLACLPPFGSADHLSYAGYGRMLVTGHDPYATGPNVLGADPFGRAVEDWRTTPSVYGPLATAGQALAALIGGGSVRLTVFVLSVLNLIAFATAGLLLHWLARRDRARQARAALLWTVNPLLLYELMAGGHVDTQAAVFVLAAVALIPPVTPNGAAAWRAIARCAVAGAVTGLGAAVKLTAALAGGGLAVTARRSWRWLAGLAVGFAVVAVAALAAGGPHVLSQTARGGSFVSIGSPWRATRTVLTAAFGAGTAHTLVSVGAVMLALILLVLFLRGLPDPAASGAGARGKAASGHAGPPGPLPGRPRDHDGPPGPTDSHRDGPPGPAQAPRWATEVPGQGPRWAIEAAPGASQGPRSATDDHGQSRRRDTEAELRVVSPARRAQVAAPRPEPPAAWQPPAEQRLAATARAALAFVLAWLFAWPYVLPWYDALGWVLLPLVAWSWLDWLLLARTAALAFGYLPARGPAARLPAGLGWLESVIRTGLTPAILAVLTVLAVLACIRGRSRA